MATRVFFSLFIVLIAAGAEPPRSLQEAQASFLEAYDAQDGARPLKILEVSPRDRPAMQWLSGTAGKDIPANPFRRGSAAWREAESVRRLSTLSVDSWPLAIESQSLTLMGSRLAFWRWGQSRVRNDRIGVELRQRWEDKLLASGPPDLIFGYALRHALCFALAQADEARFASLKARWSGLAADLFLDFQRAFALLGSPSPVFTLWKLPEIESTDRAFHALGAHRIWIAQDSGVGLPDLPADTVWIVPTKLGIQPEGEISLVEPSLSEARSLSERLLEAKRTAFLVPVRKPFETYALMYFPIVLDLDPGGIIRKICMGDAALAKGD